VLLISSFALVALGGTRKQLEGAIKYVVLNLLSSSLFVVGVGILYGLVGGLNMADIAQRVPLVENQGMVTVMAMFFLVSFGIKAAIFPMFFWLPASYHTPPAAISAIFAGMLTKVGVYALFRVFTLIFIQDIPFTHSVIIFLAMLTMLSGVLGAASQMEFRRILSFHIISQIGYMIFGLGLMTPLGIAGGVFYIFHHIIVKTNLFFVSGIVNEIKGSYLLKKLGGVLKLYPILGLLFLVPALSLGGVPPLSGFWAKFAVAKAAVQSQEYWALGVSLLVGLLTLFSMIKIWNEVFWKEQKAELAGEQRLLREMPKLKVFMMMSPIALLAIITLIIGLYPQPFVEFTNEAATQLLNPSMYINAVLRGGQ
jgi:multicomponent Na+:H+ antiporter subunit D